MRLFVNTIVICWTILILVYMVASLFLADATEAIAIFLIFLYALLGAQLLIVNFILLHQLNTLFPTEEQGRSKFRREKCFLISTLVFFSISYILVVLRNSILFSMMTGGQSAVGNWLCESNFKLSVWNIIMATFTELLPYSIIFVLNIKNFRQIKRHEKILDQSRHKSHMEAGLLNSTDTLSDSKRSRSDSNATRYVDVFKTSNSTHGAVSPN